MNVTWLHGPLETHSLWLSLYMYIHIYFHVCMYSEDFTYVSPVHSPRVP